jgi:hypothetical protein
MTNSLRRNLLMTVLVVVMISGHLNAQDMEARSYAVVPKGLHAAALSYTFSKGNVVGDAASPLTDLDLTTSIISLGYVQTFSIFNKLARVAVIQPFGFLDGTAKVYGSDTSGHRTGFSTRGLSLA